MSGDISQLTESMTGRLVAEGALAVVLAGSVVRDEAGPESDVDIYAFGSRSGYHLERHGNRLVSITWQDPDAERAAFVNPSRVGAVIPAWRSALILADSNGLAARLKADALAWTWDTIGEDNLNGYVASEVTGLAEEVHKLVSALRDGRFWTAAVQRNILALHLAPILSVHLRLLYETENRLWDLVAEGMGDQWRAAQDRAFTAPPADSFRAALQLYALAAAATSALLSPEQRDVVIYAVSLTV